jgi:hypothetical protein
MSLCVNRGLALAAVGLLLLVAGCGGRKNADLAAPARHETIVVNSLAEALERIQAAEAAGGRRAAALPDDVPADEAWAVGPPGTFAADTINHTMTLTSSGSPGTPTFQSFAVYQLPSHTGDSVEELNYNIEVTGQAYIYVVDYTAPFKWHAYGPFNANADTTLSLTDIMPVSPNGNVYVGFSAYGATTLMIREVGIDEDAPPPPTYYETEDNEVAGDPDDRSNANALPAFPFGGQSVTGSLGGADTAAYTGYDEDGVDWFSFVVNEAGTVSVTMQFFVNGGSGVGDLELELWGAATAMPLQSSVGTETAERIDYHLDTAGTYYIKCRNRDLTEDSYGDYTLWGRFWPDSAGSSHYYETEANNDSSAADALPTLPFDGSTTQVTGHIGPEGAAYDGGSQDWYSFNVADERIVGFSLFSDSEEVTPGLKLFASDGLTELAAASGGGDFTRVEALLTTPGTYFLLVEEAAADEGGSYELVGDSRPRAPGDYYETEPNDTFGTADALPAFPFDGANVDGSVGQGGGFNDGSAEDWFSFTLATEQRVDFDVERTLGSGSGAAGIYESDGTTLIVEDTSAPFDVSAILPAGTYFLQLEATSSGFDYGITGSRSDPPNYYEVEDNDSAAAANALPTLPFDYADVLGNVGNSGAYDGDTADWYSLDITQTGTVIIRMRELNTAASLDLYLYDPADTDTAIADSTSGEDIEGIHFNFTTTGTYYLEVTGSTDGSDYELMAQRITPGPYDETENNDSIGEADSLPAFPFAASEFAGNSGLEGANDGDAEDWYVVNLPASGVVTFVMNLDTVGGDIDIKMYQADGTTEINSSTPNTSTTSVETYTSDADDTDSNGSQPIPAGTYYLKVYAYDLDEDASDYTLEGSFQAE